MKWMHIIFGMNIQFFDEASARTFIEKKIGNKIKNTIYINYE